MERLSDGVYAFTESIDHGSGTARFHPAAVETDRGLLLLDAGLGGEIDQLETELDAAGFGWADVWGVALTHQDGDHAGGLATVCERADPVVFAHPECAPYVDGREDPIKGDGDRYPPVDVDVQIPDGTVFGTAAGPMEIVFTPGHAPGHVSLFLPEQRLLLAADALTAADGQLQGPSEQFTLDTSTAAESVQRLADLGVERVHCYHGGTVAADADRIRAIAADLP
jgi:glyoxylase-like metal-dependent hydrolase (beta-lactamase superfamily II)